MRQSRGFEFLSVKSGAIDGKQMQVCTTIYLSIVPRDAEKRVTDSDLSSPGFGEFRKVLQQKFAELERQLGGADIR